MGTVGLEPTARCLEGSNIKSLYLPTRKPLNVWLPKIKQNCTTIAQQFGILGL